MNDKYFEEEIKALRSGLREYKDNRKQFNAKIESILTRKADKLTDYNKDIPAQTPYNQSKLPNDLSYYKKDPSDNIETATANCISSLGETTQLSISDRTKACQQLAAKASSKGANYISQYSRGASVSQTMPAWLATYEHKFPIPSSTTINDNALKNASGNISLTDQEEPSWLTTLNHSPLERSQNQNVTNTTRNLKQASKDDMPSWATCFDYVINKEVG